MNWKAIGSESLELASDDTDWDGEQARDNIFDWAGGGDDFDQRKVKRAFFAYDEDEAENETSYKLPFAEVIDGDLKAVPKGVEAVAAVLEGARGGVDLPKEVIDEVRGKVQSYYQKMGEEVPW